ncbi:hypothetical protein Tco_0690984 [Tanacetum coccineum]
MPLKIPPSAKHDAKSLSQKNSEKHLDGVLLDSLSNNGQLGESKNPLRGPDYFSWGDHIPTGHERKKGKQHPQWRPAQASVVVLNHLKPIYEKRKASGPAILRPPKLPCPVKRELARGT